MFLACAFFSFVVAHLYFCDFYGASAIVGFVFLFFLIIILRYKILPKASDKKEFIPIFIGLVIGFYYSTYVHEQYGVIQDTTAILQTQQGKVIQISQKSVILEYEREQQKYRLRVFAEFTELNLLKGDKIIFSCNKIFRKKKGIFTVTQKLQKISEMCRGFLQAEKKFLHSPLEKFSIRVTAWLKNRLEQFPKGSLADGFILADTTRIPKLEMQLFRKMGIAHLFAASGLHLGLLFAMCYLPFLWLKIPKYGEALGLVFCTFFLILLDFPISLLRAYLFLTIYLTLKVFDRKTSPFYIYFFVACFSEILNPLSAFSYSFVLSFGITGVILLAFPFFREVLPIRWSYLKDHLALTLSAFTGSLFLSALLFGYVNILSLLYNFLLVPFAGIYLFLTILAIIFPNIANILSLLDKVFYWSAESHQFIWERFFTNIHSTFVFIWIGVLFLFFTVICILLMKKRKWYVKRWFFPVGVLLLAIYYAQFFFVRYSTFGFKAFPYGVLLYEKKQLYVFGELASFIEQGGEKFFIRPEIPVERVYASSPSIKQHVKMNTAFSFEEVHDISSERIWNVLRFKNHCFLFFSRKFNLHYAYQNTQKCSSIYMIASKKKFENLKLAYQKLKNVRKDARFFIARYNRWNWK